MKSDLPLTEQTESQGTYGDISRLVTKELIDGLRAKFPNKLPKKPIEGIELARLVGHQEVIDLLTAALREGQTGHPQPKQEVGPIKPTDTGSQLDGQYSF